MGPIVTRCERPRSSYANARSGATRVWRHQLREVGGRVGGDAAAAVRAQRAQARPHRAEPDGEERIGIVGIDDRVEDQPLDAIRMGARVRDRELGAVGDPEQRQLLGAQLDPDRLHVGDRIRRRVVLARDAQPVRAVLAGAGVAQVRVTLQARTAQQAGASGPALVVADQPVALLEVPEPGDDAQHLAPRRPCPGRPRGTSASARSCGRSVRSAAGPCRDRRPPGRAGRRASRSGRRGSRRTSVHRSSAEAAVGRARSASSAGRTALRAEARSMKTERSGQSAENAALRAARSGRRRDAGARRRA